MSIPSVKRTESSLNTSSTTNLKKRTRLEDLSQSLAGPIIENSNTTSNSKLKKYETLLSNIDNLPVTNQDSQEEATQIDDCVEFSNPEKEKTSQVNFNKKIETIYIQTQITNNSEASQHVIESLPGSQSDSQQSEVLTQSCKIGAKTDFTPNVDHYEEDKEKIKLFLLDRFSPDRDIRKTDHLFEQTSLALVDYLQVEGRLESLIANRTQDWKTFRDFILTRDFVPNPKISTKEEIEHLHGAIKDLFEWSDGKELVKTLAKKINEFHLPENRAKFRIYSET